ncbi:MAG: hypothetical protein JWQ50_5705 [Caballeronia mineralivorans]|jgi:hypothetical protein|nr:hypothetical protein [Caballeronia mineralivorans]MEA3099103.1 hypothetical protein [Caballeronia mineralivorans]
MSPELRPIKCAATAALWLVSGLTALDAFAQAGGRPLILDTQTGIHSGAGGTVLQTAPLNGSGLVPARPLATLPELPLQDQQTIVVSPYIELPQGGQGYGSSRGSQSLPSNSGHRSYSVSPHTGGSYGVPTGTQTQAQTQTQPALPQTPQSSIVISVPIAASKPVATPKPAATKPSRSSDPHSATGTVTTSLD